MSRITNRAVRANRRQATAAKRLISDHDANNIVPRKNSPSGDAVDEKTENHRGAIRVPM